ncbi:hypothetical protein CO661_00445 [Sinorhizobium fredii]|uniref:Uncharacterized protein n=1 Tax=Rhizobium fredii TaxID=380 RepID=A0A2A6M5U8_RHIFR|nr:hypothetical protein [Sinorhizobium fredii]PDT50171.1 hypothetical protein CO661_00445 [Sinorhizobium fredii]
MHYPAKIARFLYLKRENLDFVTNPPLRTDAELFNDETFQVLTEGGGWVITRFLVMTGTAPQIRNSGCRHTMVWQPAFRL